ncbi:hypothetical protein ElyMa_001121300 [Elysia marginata]|uniref:Uncharacterized protein n=1 Tax=Elysia marginata TaxID=1093978 RepID=A0AAV4HWQ4_9GAST|nr:hypothetical protein ElyMa_001121300 [Elysia marginata]
MERAACTQQYFISTQVNKVPELMFGYFILLRRYLHIAELMFGYFILPRRYLHKAELIFEYFILPRRYLHKAVSDVAPGTTGHNQGAALIQQPCRLTITMSSGTHGWTCGIVILLSVLQVVHASWW